jgi:sugar/nucleoside kinase (ribokinase family)
MSDATPLVTVVGNVGIDTQVYLPGQDIRFDVESNFTDNIDTIGQAGGYASRGFARLGYRTAFIGSVGQDPFGDWIRREFETDQIDCSGLFIDPAGTCRSINFMYRDGRRKNFYDGKSHMVLEPDVEQFLPVLKASRLVHCNIPNWARHVLPLARQQGCAISCDLQDMESVDDPYRKDFIAQSDVLFFSAVNASETRSLLSTLRDRMTTDRPVVVAGMGAKGCGVATPGEIRFFAPEELDAPIIDTNGAGDSLAVGFLSAFVLEGLSIDTAVRWGQLAARHACTLKGDSSRLIGVEDLYRYLDK